MPSKIAAVSARPSSYANSHSPCQVICDLNVNVHLFRSVFTPTIKYIILFTLINAEDVPLVEFMYLVIRRLRSLLLCLRDVFRVLINSLVR